MKLIISQPYGTFDVQIPAEEVNVTGQTLPNHFQSQAEIAWLPNRPSKHFGAEGAFVFTFSNFSFA